MQEPRASDHSSVIDDDDLPGVQEVADAGVVRIRRGSADLHVVFAHDDVVLHATLVAVVEQAVLHGPAVVEGRVPEGAWHTKKPGAHRRCCCTAVCSCRVVRATAGGGCRQALRRPRAAGEGGARRKQPLPRQTLRQRLLLRTRPSSPVLLQGRVAVQLLRLEASSCTDCGLGAGAQAEAQARHIGGGHQACALPQPRRLGGAVTRHKQVLGQGR
mmetsp:Transcript_651/g.1515  ORF Transcript_651/g.1515 Transcript_651/m.1515 type:complete len:215 (-) Transcript_651:311-955(-)